MEIKFMGTRIGKLMWILIKIAIMGLIMTGIILINKKYLSDAHGSEKEYQKIYSKGLTDSIIFQKKVVTVS